MLFPCTVCARSLSVIRCVLSHDLGFIRLGALHCSLARLLSSAAARCAGPLAFACDYRLPGNDSILFGIASRSRVAGGRKRKRHRMIQTVVVVDGILFLN